MQRPRPGHRHVIDRAVHGQGPDVAPGEEQRPDHESIGGHDHSADRRIENGLVVALIEDGIVEGGLEDLFDELSGGSSSRAMGKVDKSAADIEFPGAAPGRAHAAIRIGFFPAWSRNRP